MYKIAVFVSGRGSNLKAIIDNPQLKNKIKIVYVISSSADAPALLMCKELGIKSFVLEKNHPENVDYEQLINLFTESKIDLIVLAGFIKLIPSFFIKSFPNKIINIHPALLPDFGGKGMYGMNVHKAVFNSGNKVSGCTVHFVNEEYDKGLIIKQEKIDINSFKSPEEIASNILKLEHKLLPSIIEKFADNKIEILNNIVLIKD